MALSSLVVRSGIGAWGSIPHLIMRGLNIGAVHDIWTPQTPGSANWVASSNLPDNWVPQIAAPPDWTQQ